MSLSAKLADYEESLELLGRLTFDELKQLAKRNSIVLQKEDAEGNFQKVKSKEEAIEILVTSEFKESDLVELLGVNRLTKEEILNLMSVHQLKKLANETGVLLEKSTLLGTKKAIKKKDVVKALKVLSLQKVRQYAEKTEIIWKTVREKRKPSKVATKKLYEKTASRKMQKPKAASQPVYHFPDMLSRIEEKKVASSVIYPRQVQLDVSQGVEETVKEVRVERQIIRRQLSFRQQNKEREKTRDSDGKLKSK